MTEYVRVEVGGGRAVHFQFCISVKVVRTRNSLCLREEKKKNPSFFEVLNNYIICHREKRFETSKPRRQRRR